MLNIINKVHLINNKTITNITSSISKRYFLSNSYSLDAEYNARLNNKFIKKISPTNMYLELDQQYNRHKILHAIDVDLYVNSITDDVHTEELEDILYKFRLTPSTIDIMESTQHAFIRLYLKLNKINELISILNDRLNYGIFSDDYCNNLLMNHFIKNKNFRDAAMIASIQMLQEDFSNDITKHLALYSCVKYLESPTAWVQERVNEGIKEDDEVNDEDDEVKIRVGYLRNPYFDGHFDLKSPNDLIGKTFISIGRTSDDPLFKSYYLIGLGLMKNIEEAKVFLTEVETGKHKVYKESVELFKKYLIVNDVSESLAEDENVDKSGSEEVKDVANPPDENVKLLLTHADKIINLGIDEKILENTESKLKEILKLSENNEIEKQKETYKKWDIERELILKRHVEKLKQDQIFESIELKKKELEKEEEKLFFFDNEDKIELMLEEKYPKPPVIIKKKRNEFDGMRNKGRTEHFKSKKVAVDENYVPPEMHKPYQS